MAIQFMIPVKTSGILFTSISTIKKTRKDLNRYEALQEHGMTESKG